MSWDLRLGPPLTHFGVTLESQDTGRKKCPLCLRDQDRDWQIPSFDLQLEENDAVIFPAWEQTVLFLWPVCQEHLVAPWFVNLCTREQYITQLVGVRY